MQETMIMIRRHTWLTTATICVITLSSVGCAAQHQFGGGAIPDEPPPYEVRQMLADVSPQRVKGYVDTLAGFGTRHTLSDTTSNTRGIGAARRWIKSQFEQFANESGRVGDERMPTYLEPNHYEPDGRRVFKPVDVTNVIAVLPGSMPEAKDRYYYVLGHYDSRASEANDAESDAPGANDDGSGAALVMELARVMSKHKFDSTIVFMTTAGEEQGLLGAKGHVKRAIEAGEDIRAALSNDIVGDPRSPFGGEHEDQIRVFSEGLPINFDERRIRGIRALSSEADSPSRQLARYIAETAAWHGTEVAPMLVDRADRFLRGGDHTPFNEAGYPAVRFTVVEENYNRQHQNVRVEDGVQYGDLPEFVDGEYLAGVARVNLAALAHLANAPSTPTNSRIITARLTPSTTLRWDRSPEPDVAGYEILWRETTSPVWQHAKDVGNVNEVTLDISKDNNFFAVRAYDKDGFRSMAAFPRAARE